MAATNFLNNLIDLQETEYWLAAALILEFDENKHQDSGWD